MAQLAMSRGYITKSCTGSSTVGDPGTGPFWLTGRIIYFLFHRLHRCGVLNNKKKLIWHYYLSDLLILIIGSLKGILFCANQMQSIISTSTGGHRSPAVLQTKEKACSEIFFFLPRWLQVFDLRIRNLIAGTYSCQSHGAWLHMTDLWAFPVSLDRVKSKERTTLHKEFQMRRGSRPYRVHFAVVQYSFKSSRRLLKCSGACGSRSENQI